MRQYITYIALFLLPYASIAQTELDSKDIVVENEFEGIIQDASKIDILSPDLINSDSIREGNYNLPPQLMDVEYEQSNLRPVAMPEEISLKAYNSYIRAGFGTQTSPLLEVAYNDRNVKNLLFGFRYKHLSTNSSKIDFQRFSRNTAGTYLNYSMKQVKMKTEFNFDRRVNHFYGAEYPDSVSRKDVRNRVRDFTFRYDIANLKELPSGVNFNADIGFLYLKDERDTRDYNINFNSSVSKEVMTDHKAKIGFSVNYNSFKDPFDVEIKNTVISIRPEYEFSIAGFTINGMVNATIDNELIYLLPAVEVERHLFEGYLIGRIGWNKFHQQNTYRSFILENPYLSSLFIRANSRGSKLWFGLNGSFRSFSYNIEGSVKQFKRLPLYENNPFSPQEFIVRYDGNTNIQNIHTDFGIDISKYFKVFAGMDYNFYDTEKVPKALHLPSFISNFGALYNLDDKILFRLDIAGFSKQYALDTEGELTEIKGFADINIEATYQFSEYLSFFVNINNIASRKYERWLNYPTYGFNGMLGAKFKY